MRAASTGRPPSARAAFAASASGERAVPEARARADDPGADRADDRVVALCPRPGEARTATRDAAATSPSKQGATATAASSSPRILQRAHGVRERDGQRAAAAAARTRRAPAGERGATGATWLCSEQQTTGSPSSDSARLAVLLAVRERELARRVRQRHHVRAVLGREPEPARQVRVEDVEAARAELEQARLLVDEHVVAHLDLAGQPRVGDARDPVDLEPDEPSEPLARPP